MRQDTRLDPHLLPPSSEERAQKPQQKNVVWWNQFQAGRQALEKKDRGTACVRFRELALTPEFPLRELSTLLAHEACVGTENLTPPEYLTAETLRWFEEASIRARAVHADELTTDQKVRLLWDQARLEKSDRQRERFLMDAVSVAEKGDNPPLVEEAKDRLWKNSPRLKPEPAPQELAAVVRDLRKWREFSAAIQLERKRLRDKGLSDDERFRILKNIRETWKVAQRKEEMLKATDELLKFAKESDRRNKKNTASTRRLLEARTTHVRAWWTENRRSLAWKSLNEAVQELKGRTSLEEIYFLMARMEEEAKKLAEAQDFLKLALEERPSIPGLREKMLWARAWILHKMDRKPEAIQAFTEIIESSKDVSEVSRSRFWRARHLTDESERRAELEKTRDEDPLGFYGMMAMRELGDPLPPIQSPASQMDLSLWQSSELPLKWSVMAEWLISLEWHEGLGRLLNDIQSELRKNSSASRDAWLRMATAYARGGEYLPLFILMNQIPADLRDQLLKEKPELLFPQPWKEEVQQAALAARVPPELIYAIMRQESAFNPRARSHAEAYGLMQLLPNVASRLASRFKTEYQGPESLYEPKIVIPLGAFEIRTLKDRWKELWIPSVASYNAAEKAVRGWLEFRKREDTLEFIEEIPYEETRGYVKLVMRNQVFYQRLMASEPTPFPENCLKLFHTAQSD